MGFQTIAVLSAIGSITRVSQKVLCSGIFPRFRKGIGVARKTVSARAPFVWLLIARRDVVSIRWCVCYPTPISQSYSPGKSLLSPRIHKYRLRWFYQRKVLVANNQIVTKVIDDCSVYVSGDKIRMYVDIG